MVMKTITNMIFFAVEKQKKQKKNKKYDNNKEKGTKAKTKVTKSRHGNL